MTKRAKIKQHHIAYYKALYIDYTESEQLYPALNTYNKNLLIDAFIRIKEPYIIRRNKIVESIFMRFFKKYRDELKKIDRQLDKIESCIYFINSYNMKQILENSRLNHMIF